MCTYSNMKFLLTTTDDEYAVSAEYALTADELCSARVFQYMLEDIAVTNDDDIDNSADNDTCDEITYLPLPNTDNVDVAGVVALVLKISAEQTALDIDGIQCLLETLSPQKLIDALSTLDVLDMVDQTECRYIGEQICRKLNVWKEPALIPILKTSVWCTVFLHSLSLTLMAKVLLRSYYCQHVGPDCLAHWLSDKLAQSDAIHFAECQRGAKQHKYLVYKTLLDSYHRVHHCDVKCPYSIQFFVKNKYTTHHTPHIDWR